MPKPPSPATSPAGGACPICRRPTEPRYRPFCSGRCADVDLGRWFTESYRVPVAEAEEEQPAGPEDLPG